MITSLLHVGVAVPIVVYRLSSMYRMTVHDIIYILWQENANNLSELRLQFIMLNHVISLMNN